MQIRLNVVGGPEDGSYIEVVVPGDSLIPGKRIRAKGVVYDVIWEKNKPKKLQYSRVNNGGTENEPARI